ncbi:MAG: heme-copper oxidase subunit III [Akkermansiaceae bacterium]|jgi:heme/copper-type cytochrome/quinol oxidase subunit 3
MEIPYIVNARKDTGLFNAKIAIWLFLASEVMLFGGFFSAYVFMRLGADYPWPERTLPVLPGLINTFVLIGSSVTVVFAWAALKLRNWRQFQIYMWITVICALIFMVLKGVEYNVKFHHQAVRLKDYTVLEGHLAYIDGTKIEKNRINLELNPGSTIIYNNLRVHDAWVEEILAEAKAAGATLKLAAEVKGAEGFSDADTIYFAKDADLTVELLDKFEKAQIKARNHNQKIRTQALRDAWKVAEKQNPNKSNWEYSDKVSIDQEAIKSKLLTDIPAATFVADKSFQISFKPRDVKEGLEQSKLRDDTVINAKLLPSPMDFHYLDAIDFQYLVMKAEKKGIKPEVAIENSWLLKNDPFAREAWAWHQANVDELKKRLIKDYGLDEKGNPNREPTHKELYRIGWKEFAKYGEETHKIKLSVTDKLKEEFMGPNYKARNPDEKESNSHDSHEEVAHGDSHDRVTFPHLSVPREQIGFASKFTPSWNTYYAIYFTITGLHGLHVVGGAIVLAYYLFFGRRMYEENPEWLCNRVEVGGLFWHFVDLIWIFVFPILYLM